VEFNVMARLRARKLVAVLCAVLVLFAAFAPAVASLPVAILTPLWLVVPATAVVIVRRNAARCNEQPTSLLSLFSSRAPPPALAIR
jgi:hypothetical protein